MQYLQRSYDLAEARGYFRCSAVLVLQDGVPNWFRALGTESGLAEFETGHGVRMPLALREFYECLPLACFVEAAIDGEIFLADLAELVGNDLPPIITWSSEKHVAVAFHGHSGTICAARLGSDDPSLFWGDEADPEPYPCDEYLPTSFSDLVFRVVDGHEEKLDYWQKAYYERQANPAELRRLGSIDWVRHLAGMVERLTCDEGLHPPVQPPPQLPTW